MSAGSGGDKMRKSLHAGVLMPIILGLSLLMAVPPVAGGEASARAQALEAADDELFAAGRALEEATSREAEGAQPLPGERTGTINGRSRLNEDYFRRQEQLKEEVMLARRRFDEALERRNSLRD